MRSTARWAVKLRWLMRAVLRLGLKGFLLAFVFIGPVALNMATKTALALPAQQSRLGLRQAPLVPAVMGFSSNLIFRLCGT